MKISCIAIDDEPMALAQIAAYVQKTPFLELISGCRSAFEAMDVLRAKPIQLLFIDINMPDLNGMDFVKSLTIKPYVVFTTAYSEYALEGFRVDAIDYLLKPISYENFLKASNKVRSLIDLKQNPRVEKSGSGSGYLFVKADYKILRIEMDQIRFVESMHEYVRIHLTDNRRIMTLASMKSIEEMLPAETFMRVHRSYLVNLAYVSVIERNRIVFDGNTYIPVSDQYKAKFQEYIDRRQI